MRARRRGALLAAVALAAAVVAVVAYRHCDRGASHAGSEDREVAGVPGLTNRATAAQHGPRWFGQHGLGARQVAGIVLRDGAPVAGASVRLASVLSVSGGTPEPRVTTDAAGRFDFGPQLPIEYAVIAEAPHTLGAMETIDLRDPDAEPALLQLLLHACDAAIYGTIRDAAGGVVPHARVARIFGVVAGAGTEAGDDGTYELCIAIASDSILVKADGYAQHYEMITAYARLHHDFELTPEATIMGRVVRMDDHSPVGGALVELTTDEFGPAESGLTRYASSDSQGNFRFDAVSPGNHSLEASADRLVSPRRVHVIAEVGTPHEVVCPVAPALTLSGKVIEHGSGTPIAGVTVSLTLRARIGGRQSLDGVTQRDGTFVIERMVPGEYEPDIDAYDVVGKPKVSVGKADVSGVVIEVERGASITGRVRRDGKPVDGALVRAMTSQETGTPTGATTGPDGRYTLRGLGPGSYRVYAESQRLGAFTNGPTVSVTKGEQKQGIDVDLDLEASIAGTVVDQNDAPVVGALVRFSLLHGNDFGNATTGEDGSFVARALAGGGSYTYDVRANESSPASYPPADGKRFAPIPVRDARSHVTGLRIKIRIDRRAISGRVLDGAGKPLPDVVIRAFPEHGVRWFTTLAATSDVAGAFTIRDLAPGTYNLTAKSVAASEELPHVEAGRKDVVIRMSEAGALSCTLDGFGEDVEVVAMRIQDPSTTTVPFGPVQYYAVVSAKTCSIPRLPAGGYELYASSTEGEDHQVVVIRPGATANVALRVRGYGAVEGTVTDESSHAPLAELMCAAGRADSSSRSDARGAFRIERVLAGETYVFCQSQTAIATSKVVVIAGQTVHLDLAAHSETDRRNYIGMEFEDQLGEVLVKSVVPGGPADRAGVAVGDVMVSLGAIQFDSDPSAHWKVENLPIGSSQALIVERGDKRLTLTLTIEAAP